MVQEVLQRSGEPRRWGAQWLAVEADNKLRSSKLILLQLHTKLPKNSMSTILQLSGTRSKLETWKSSIIGCLISWPKILKNCFEVSSSLILCNNNNKKTISQLDCDVQQKVDFIMTTGDNQLSGWTKKKLQSTSQAKFAPRKGQGHCLVLCCLSDRQQLSESWRNHYIWEICSVNW